jgi:VWFA-related protein
MNLQLYRSLFRILPVAILLALLCGVSVQAQVEEPTEQEPVLDVGHTEEVQVVMRRIDFLALDKKGRPITDLRPEEVRIWEAEEEQKIIDLLPVYERRETIQLLKDAETKPAEAPSAEPVAEQTAPIPEIASAPPAINRRWIIFYFDANNLSLQGRLRAGKALRELAKSELRPGDRVALLVDEDELRILVPFSTQTEVLLSYLEDPQGLTRRSRDLERRLKDVLETAEDCRGALYHEQRAQCAKQAVSSFLMETSRETERSLDHLEALLRSLGAIPDRKILFLVSEGFMLDPGDVAAATVEYAVGQIGYGTTQLRTFLARDFTHRVEKIYQIATESRTGIYPVNTLRKMIDDEFSPENRRDSGPDNILQARTDPFEASWQQVTKLHREMARATGGVPVLKRDPRDFLTDQLRAADGVYTAFYYPTDHGFDRRKINIKTTRKGVKLFFRNRYRHIARNPHRLDGEIVIDASPEQLAAGYVQARLKVVSGTFELAPDSNPPASLACLFFELRNSTNRVVKDHYEVIAFPRGGELEEGHLERPFAVMVPAGDYTLQVEVRDVHGAGWGSFIQNFSVGTGG